MCARLPGARTWRAPPPYLPCAAHMHVCLRPEPHVVALWRGGKCECERDARRFGSGISSQGCLLDAAEATGVVSKKGSWYFYGEQRLAQGRDKTLAELAASAPLAECAARTSGPCAALAWRAGDMLSGDVGPKLRLTQSQRACALAANYCSWSQALICILSLLCTSQSVALAAFCCRRVIGCAPHTRRHASGG